MFPSPSVFAGTKDIAHKVVHIHRRSLSETQDVTHKPSYLTFTGHITMRQDNGT